MPLPSNHPYYKFGPAQESSAPIPSTLEAPYTIANTIQLWFRGDKGLTTTAWSNYGASGSSNLTNVGTISLGTYSQGGTMSGVGQYANVGTGGYWNLAAAPSFANDFRAVFAVYKLSSLSSGQTWTIFGSGSSGNGYGMNHCIYNGPSPYFREYLLSVGVFLPVDSYSTLNPTSKFYTHSMVWGSNSAASYCKVGATVSTVSNSPNWTPDYGIGFYNPSWIGYGSNPAQPGGITMSICEFMMIDGTMSTTDTATIDAWLNTRWGSGVN